LYRAIDRDGNLVDTMLSQTHDSAAARAFSKQAMTTVGNRPERITTDKYASYRRTIRRILGRKVLHRTKQYLNNRIEQDHRGIKQRYYPMRDFGSYTADARFCAVFSELRHYFRLRRTPARQSSALSRTTSDFPAAMDSPDVYLGNLLIVARLGRNPRRSDGFVERVLNSDKTST
jgi:putative transposase